jgi:hypothetical protein
LIDKVGLRLNTDPDPARVFMIKQKKLYKIHRWKKISLDKKFTFYLSLGLHKGCPSYKRSLQLSTENN